MKLREVMRTAPWTINDTDTLGAAQRLMTRNGFRHLPVLSEGRLAGMLSERDILAERARADEVPWWAISVREAMPASVKFAHPDDPVVEIEARMASDGVDALPVVDHGRVVGLVTATDVLQAEVRAAMGPAVVPTVADAMTSHPLTATPETRVLDVIATMVDHKVRHVPVVDGNGALLGVISERDVRYTFGALSPEATARVRAGIAREVMSRPPVSTRVDTPLVDAMRSLVEHRFGALPVVDGKGRLVGILSYVDALRVMTR